MNLSVLPNLVCEKCIGYGSCIEMYDITLAGVQLCKHADVIKSTPLHPNETGYLILFKIIKVSFSFLRHGTGTIHIHVHVFHSQVE